MDLSIPGWASKIELEWLASHAGLSYIVLEVGPLAGRSTKAMADRTPGIVHVVDPWSDQIYEEVYNYYRPEDDPRAIDIFYAALADHLQSGRVVVHRALFEAPVLGSIRPDMIMLDGDHRYHAVRHDIKEALKVAADNCLLVGHIYGGDDRAVRDELGQVDIFNGTLWFKRFRS